MTANRSDAERISDEAFNAWRDSLPQTHWARYDLAACRLGWDARDKALREQGEREIQYGMQSTVADRHPKKIIIENNPGTPPDPRLAHSSPDAPVSAEPKGEQPGEPPPFF